MTNERYDSLKKAHENNELIPESLTFEEKVMLNFWVDKGLVKNKRRYAVEDGNNVCEMLSNHAKRKAEQNEKYLKKAIESFLLFMVSFMLGVIVRFLLR